MNDGYDSLENSVRGGMIHRRLKATGGLLQSASSSSRITKILRDGHSQGRV